MVVTTQAVSVSEFLSSDDLSFLGFFFFGEEMPGFERMLQM